MRGAVRDLLHDLGHDLATLSCLVEGLRGDPQLPLQARRKVELIDQEMTRLRDHMRRAVVRTSEAAVVCVREVAGRIVTLADEAAETSVVLRPGAPVSMRVDEAVLWRIIKNLVDNAVRAAGPDGRVEVDVTNGGPVVVEVADDGPGFLHGSAGWATRGLNIVTGLAAAWGGNLDVRARLPRGTCVRIVFHGEP